MSEVYKGVDKVPSSISCDPQFYERLVSIVGHITIAQDRLKLGDRLGAIELLELGKEKTLSLIETLIPTKEPIGA